MATFSKATALVAVTALAVVLATAGPVMAQSSGQTSTDCDATLNPLASLDYTNTSIAACVSARCVTTLGAAPTSVTSGYCNGVATAESSVACGVMEPAYSAYYACLMRALAGTPTGDLATVGTQSATLISTPGSLYRLTSLNCLACNHYRLSVYPTSGSVCTTWTCGTIAAMSPTAPLVGLPDKGYNHRLCSTGCIAAMMMIPFVGVSAFMFLACCCCWPSPSLKTTYAEMLREEEVEKMRRRSDDDDEPNQPADDDRNIVHEPAPAQEHARHPEEAASEHSSKGR